MVPRVLLLDRSISSLGYKSGNCFERVSQEDAWCRGSTAPKDDLSSAMGEGRTEPFAHAERPLDSEFPARIDAQCRRSAGFHESHAQGKTTRLFAAKCVQTIINHRKCFFGVFIICLRGEMEKWQSATKSTTAQLLTQTRWQWHFFGNLFINTRFVHFVTFAPFFPTIIAAFVPKLELELSLEMRKNLWLRASVLQLAEVDIWNRHASLNNRDPKAYIPTAQVSLFLALKITPWLNSQR